MSLAAILRVMADGAGTVAGRSRLQQQLRALQRDMRSLLAAVLRCRRRGVEVGWVGECICACAVAA